MRAKQGEIVSDTSAIMAVINNEPEKPALAEPLARSPLDVEGIDTGVSTEEIVAFIREGRERFADVDKGDPQIKVEVA